MNSKGWIFQSMPQRPLLSSYAGAGLSRESGIDAGLSDEQLRANYAQICEQILWITRASRNASG
jgi:hypothetical protein